MEKTDAFFILDIGGKQIRCSPGDKILVDKMNVKQGDKIKIKRVLNTTGPSDDFVDCTVDTPLVLGEKIRIYKTRRRKGYEKTIGFRKKHTRIIVGDS